MIKIISHKTIESLDIAPLTCLKWVDEMLLQKKEAVLPPKISLTPENDSFFNVMPCLIPNSSIGGVKVITRKMGRVPALDSILTLFDYNTLLPKAIMDASWVTTMRTGAVAIHTMDLLANPDFKEVGVMGLGNTGRAAIKIMCDKYKEKEFVLKVLKYKDQHLLLEKMIRGESGTDNSNIQICFVDTYEEVIQNSDVIISAVTFIDHDFAPIEMYKPGCLVIAIHLRGFMNCDTTFDKVYGDDTGHLKKFKYFNEFKSFAECAEVIRGEKPGRESANERILAYNVGLSLHDMFFAGKVYSMIEKEDIKCMEFDLEPPTEKTWLYNK